MLIITLIIPLGWQPSSDYFSSSFVVVNESSQLMVSSVTDSEICPAAKHLALQLYFDTNPNLCLDFFHAVFLVNLEFGDNLLCRLPEQVWSRKFPLWAERNWAGKSINCPLWVVACRSLGYGVLCVFSLTDSNITLNKMSSTHKSWWPDFLTTSHTKGRISEETPKTGGSNLICRFFFKPSRSHNWTQTPNLGL